MLSAKPWTSHSIIFLLAGIFGCIALTALVIFLAVPQDQAEQPHWKLFSFVTSTVGFQGGVLICIKLFLREHRLGWSDAFGFRSTSPSRALALGAITALLMTPLAWGLGKLSAVVMHFFEIDPAVQTTVETLRQSSSGDDQLRFGILAILLAPVVEEMLFRGIFYPSLKQAGLPRASVLITALLFGAIHGNAMSFVPLALFGIVLVGLYEMTDNLLAPISAHALFNLINFLFVVNPEWGEALPEWLK